MVNSYIPLLYCLLYRVLFSRFWQILHGGVLLIFNRWLTELLSEKRALPPPNRRFHALSFSPWQALFGPRQAGKARPPRLGTYRPRRRPPPFPAQPLAQPPAYSVFRLDAAKLPFFCTNPSDLPSPAHPLIPSLTFHPHSHSQHLPI